MRIEKTRHTNAFVTVTTIILMIFTANRLSSNSFFENLIEVPLWAFGCFLVSGIVFFFPVIITDYIFERLSKTYPFNEFENFSKPKKIIFIFLIIIAFWLGLSFLVTKI